MENTGALGPRPSDAAEPSPALSQSRAALLDILRDQLQPTGLAALAALAHLHENTVRGHLEGLEEIGLVTRQTAAPDGRGRPAHLWRAVARHPVPEYAGLAAALAGSLQRTSRRPVDDALVAGHEWGTSLARGRPGADVVELMDGLGFRPETGTDRGDIRLTRCPLLEVARQHTAIVCNVHTGLVQGALFAQGDDATEVDLTPFAEPGACRLRLRRRPE